MRSKHEYELPAIKLDTPRDRYESAYRLVRFFDLNDQRDAVYSLLEMIFGAKLWEIVKDHRENAEYGEDYDPDISTATQWLFPERFKNAKRVKGILEHRDRSPMLPFIAGTLVSTDWFTDSVDMLSERDNLPYRYHKVAWGFAEEWVKVNGNSLRTFIDWLRAARINPPAPPARRQ